MNTNSKTSTINVCKEEESHRKSDNNCNSVAKASEEPSSGSEEGFAFSSGPTLEQIRELHAKFACDRNWDQFHTPRNVLLALVAEMGELSELFQWKNECAVGLEEWTLKERKALEEELSDCLIYLVRLADRCRVDLPTAVVNKLAANETKYPISKVFGSSKKYTEYE